MVHKRNDTTIIPKDEWGTPPQLFRGIEKFLGIKFTLDPCTSKSNPLGVAKFYTLEDDGLIQDYGGEAAYVNCPYSPGSIPRWVDKCRAEAKKPDTEIAMLLPSDTSTKVFHRILDGTGIPIFITEGRVKHTGGPSNPPQFGSLIYWLYGNSPRLSVEEKHGLAAKGHLSVSLSELMKLGEVA